MTKIIIKALEKKGHAAIMQHWKETSKLTLKNRLLFKTAGYTQELLEKDPATLCLIVKNRHAKNPIFVDLLRGEIEKAMKSNGANKSDYLIEVNYNE